MGFWAGGCGGGWLSFGPAMFVIVVGGGVCGCSGFRCVGFGSLINWLGWDFGPMVVSWLWWWLVEFWATVFVAVVGRQCLFLFLFLFSFVEIFGFGICWRSTDCDCSLWRLICCWW